MVKPASQSSTKQSIARLAPTHQSPPQQERGVDGMYCWLPKNVFFGYGFVDDEMNITTKAHHQVAPDKVSEV